MKYKPFVIMLFLLVALTITSVLAIFLSEKSTIHQSEKNNGLTISHLEHDSAQIEPKGSIAGTKAIGAASEQPVLTTPFEEIPLVKPTIIEFIEVNSDLHQELLEKLLAENTKEKVKNEPLLVSDGKVYVPYVTDFGIEFYQLRIELLKQITTESNPYQFQLELLEKQILEEGQSSSVDGSFLYQIIEQLDLADVQLVNLVCRGQMCLAQLVHPNSRMNAVESFVSLIKKNRQECQCKVVYLPFDDFSESVFQFVFD